MTAEQLLDLADRFRRQRREYLAKSGLVLKHPLSENTLTLLLRLHFHEQPETMGQLATALGLRNEAVTYHADALEKQGFAIRRYQEHDRRQIVLVIPDETRQKVTELVADLQKFHATWDRRLAGLQMPESA